MLRRSRSLLGKLAVSLTSVFKGAKTKVKRKEPSGKTYIGLRHLNIYTYTNLL